MVTLGIGGHQNLQGRCVQARPVRLTPLSGARAHPLHLTTGRTSRLNRPRFDYNSDSVARAAATDREAQPGAQEAEGAVSDAPVKVMEERVSRSASHRAFVFIPPDARF